METQGQRIKKIRQALNKSQEEFGEIFNMKKQNVSSLENDKAFLNNEKLTKLLIEYKVSIDYVLGGIGNMFITDGAAQYENIKNDVLKEVKIMLLHEGLIK